MTEGDGGNSMLLDMPTFRLVFLSLEYQVTKG